MAKKGGAKAKAASKAASKAAPSKAKRTQPAASSTAPAESLEVARKKRPLMRRETEAQTQRFIDRKLSHVPASVLETVENCEGLKVRDYIAREVKRVRRSHGRLSSKFMVKLYDEYQLEATVFMGVPEPSEDESVDEELLDLLGQCHDENPVHRNHKPLAKYLQSCRRLSYTNLFGLLKGIVEGPLLSHSNAQKLQVSALEYFARTRADLKFPAMWRAAKAQLDLSLKEAYEKQAESGVRVLTWLRNKKDILALFVSIDDLDAADRSNGDWTSIPRHIQAIVNSCMTGKCMFKHVWLGCARELYIEEVRQAIASLEHCDYNEDETSNFRTLMAQKVASLKSQGHRRMTWRMTTQIYNTEITIDMDDPADEWQLRLQCRVKTISLNTRQVAPLWYEDILFPKHSMEGVPKYMQLPKALIGTAESARTTVADLLDGVEEMSEAIKIVTKAADALLDLDKTFECDLAFLSQKAMVVLQERVQAEVLGALPSNDVDVEFPEALRRLAVVRALPVVRAGGKSVENEVDGIVALITHLSQGVPPREKDIPRLSTLCKLVLKLAGNFYKIVVKTQATIQGAVVWTQQILRGKAGVEYTYDMVAAKMKNDSALTMDEIKPLKQFGWLLNGQQQEQLQQWISDVVKRYSISGDKLCLTEGADDNTKIVAASSSDRSAQRQDLSMASSASSSKKAVAAEEKTVDKKAMMMKFFVRRGST